MSRGCEGAHAMQGCYEGHNFQGSMPRMSSDVVEVTNIAGDVGFVAVGRIIRNSLSNEEVSSYNYLGNQSAAKSNKRHSKTKHKKNQVAPRSDDGLLMPEIGASSHERHHSEPLINFEYTHVDMTSSRHANTADSVALRSNTADGELLIDFETTINVIANTNAPAYRVHKRSKKGSTEHLMEIDDADEVTRDKPLTSNNNQTMNDATSNHRGSSANASPHCKQCGQRHRLTENHEYNYIEDADDDLQCDICLQPFLDPYDTKCGHTFCCICLKNYVRLKKMCPIDRKDLTCSSSDCWQSSLVMRKLVNKLIVRCPNEELCQLTLPRTDLEAHLKERCPGSLLRCTKATFGCSYRGPRVEQKDHIKCCKYQHLTGNPVDSFHPNCTKHTVELFRPEGISELGLSIVGGNDTPLRNIIVQSTVPYGLVAGDGRIHPGDIITEVNGEDFHNITHVEARAILCRSSHLMRFKLLREKVAPVPDPYSLESASGIYTEKISVCLLKPPSDQLGIKITTCDDGTPGIYILELVKGRVAHASGLLRVGDRILEISHLDLWNGTPEAAARIIQNSGERVDIIVSRRATHVPAPTIANPRVSEKTAPRSTSHVEVTMNDSIPYIPTVIHPISASYTEKVISVKKAPQESLGIIVAGGAHSARGDLPVFVQNVQPLGVLGKDRRLMKGDLLLKVNGIDLNGLTHDEAIAILKDAAQHCKEVVLYAIELNYKGKAEDFALWEELSGVHHQHGRREVSRGGNIWASWTPSWRMWLAVPPFCRITRDVAIKRNPQCGLGFSIIGGRSERSLDKVPVFVKYVVPSGPAEVLGGVRCGDEIVAINGRDASSMNHCDVVLALKNILGSVSLTIMSWPGSTH